MGNLGDFGTNRTVFPVVWHVAILGPNRSLRGMGKADVVRCTASWLLVGKLPVLLFRVPFSSI